MFSRKPDATPPREAPAQGNPGDAGQVFGETVLRLELAAQDAVEEARLARGHFAAEQLERERVGPLRRMVAWLRGSR